MKCLQPYLDCQLLEDIFAFLHYIYHSPASRCPTNNNWILILSLHLSLLSEETIVWMIFWLLDLSIKKKKWWKSMQLDSHCLHSSRFPHGRPLTCFPIKRLFMIKVVNKVDVSNRDTINKFLTWVIYTATVKNNYVSLRKTFCLDSKCLCMKMLSGIDSSCEINMGRNLCMCSYCGWSLTLMRAEENLFVN